MMNVFSRLSGIDNHYNEALARDRINMIFMIPMDLELQAIRPGLTEPASSPADLAPLATTSERSSTPVRLTVRFETYLKRRVTYQGKQRLLQGRADYSLWYDQDDPIGTNLVLVEAKKKGCRVQAEGQLVAYMGE